MAIHWRFTLTAIGIFRVNATDAASGDGKTEFGRVVERLAIDSIHVLTPQAKGRVERANYDRLASMTVTAMQSENYQLPQ